MIKNDNQFVMSAIGVTKFVAYVILFSLIGITFGPSRGLTQIFPFLVFPIVFLLYKRTRVPPVFTLIFLIFIYLSILSAVMNGSPIINYLIGIITWFGSILTLVISFKIGKYVKLETLVKFLIYISLIQIPIGLYQVYSYINFTTINPFSVDASIGDLFGGTLLTSGVNSHIVGIKLAFSVIIFYLYYDKLKMNKMYLIPLILGWITPSAIHSFICGIFAVITYLANNIKFKRSTRLFLLVSIAILFAILTQSTIANYVYSLFYRTIEFSDLTPRKIIAFYRTIFELSASNPHIIFTGLGLGRYSSYAALILTGEFLRYQPWYLPISISSETNTYILPYWNRALLEKNIWAHGVANQPFFTYMSLYGELGIIGLFIFVVFWIRILRFLKTVIEYNYHSNLAQALLVYSYFLLYLFFFDNWFEDARLMMPYFVILGVLYSHFYDNYKTYGLK